MLLRLRQYRSLRSAFRFGSYFLARDWLGSKYLRKQVVELLFLDFHVTDDSMAWFGTGPEGFGPSERVVSTFHRIISPAH